jgi:hypothetical protein
VFLQEELARSRNLMLGDSGFEVEIRFGTVLAADRGGEGDGRVDEEVPVLELENGLLIGLHLHVAEAGGSREVLGIEGSQTGGTDATLENPVSFTHEEPIDVMAVHEVGIPDADSEPVSARDGEDVGVDLRDKGGLVVQWDRKRSETKKTKDGVDWRHGNVKNKSDKVFRCKERNFKLEKVRRMFRNEAATG